MQVLRDKPMITIFNRQKLIECNTEEIRMKAGQCLKNNNIEYKVKYKSSSNSFRDVEKRTFTGGYGSKVILKPIEATIYVKKEDYNKASGLIKFL